MKLGYAGPEKGCTRWCSTMNGREFGRVHSWGSGPKRGVCLTTLLFSPDASAVTVRSKGKTLLMECFPSGRF